ncbi:LPXTG cell wall anchor domain-containing protein [Candidatus Woesearchaeota archaeon]|nr:LPXTG cell wall anchor domain-containing protein [Candidatus Woesearchaeota archaeon]
MNKKILVWIIVLLISLPLVFSLGLRPAKTTFDFQPELNKEFQFKIVNNDYKDLDVELTIEGELAKYLKLSEDTVHLDKDQELAYVTITADFPEELPPGTIESQIIVTEKLPDVDVSGNVFTARLKIAHKVIVNVPYPNKYLDAEIGFEENADSINITLSAKNLGQEDIGALKTTFEVYDNDRKLVSVKTGEESLGADQNTVLSASINKSEVEYGEFNVLASIFYDEYWLELERNLIQGDPEIDILFFDKYFIFGKINKFTVNLLNNWNKKLENVFVEVFVFKDDNKIDEIRTASFDIEGRESENIGGYFDATDKDIGDYEFDVVVNYDGKKTHQRFKGSILDEEEYKNMGGNGNWAYILIGILIGLAILILGILLRRRRED